MISFKVHVDDNAEDLARKFGDENVFLFPCGSCENCRRNYANEWAIRCSLEAQMHKYNYFITLTYDDRHIQYSCIEDLRKFFDRLSGYKHKNKFKYFACMEKGEHTERNHFHIVLFSDFELDLKEPQWIHGFYYYHSSKLEELWTFGWHNVAPFESNCARYVAKYTSKNKSKIIMSRNLSKSYFDFHKLDIIKDNFVVYGDFGSKKFTKIPSCFVRWFGEEIPELTSYKEFNKELGKIYSAYSLRVLGSASHRGETRETNRSLIKDKKKGVL